MAADIEMMKNKKDDSTEMLMSDDLIDIINTFPLQDAQALNHLEGFLEHADNRKLLVREFRTVMNAL